MYMHLHLHVLAGRLYLFGPHHAPTENWPDAGRIRRSTSGLPTIRCGERKKGVCGELCSAKLRRADITAVPLSVLLLVHQMHQLFEQLWRV
jgi:hypothetical protein